MKEGIVKFFDDQKGFGFIKDNSDSKEYFTTAAECMDEIEENDIVSFDLKNSPRGLVAINVKLI